MFNAKIICRLTKKSKIKKLQNIIKEQAMLGEDRMGIILNSPINGVDIDDNTIKYLKSKGFKYEQVDDKHAIISWR